MTMEQLTLIGIVIQTGIFLFGGVVLVIRNDGSNKNLARQVEGIERELKILAEVVTQMAVAQERLNNLSTRMNMLDKRMDDLVTAEGWLAGRRIVDGEYPPR